MLTKFTNRFLKDLEKLKQASVRKDISDIIVEIEDSNFLSEIKNIKKLKGYTNAYRIRSGDYRIGILLEDEVVKLGRVAHRKDIYKVFP